MKLITQRKMMFKYFIKLKGINSSYASSVKGSMKANFTSHLKTVASIPEGDLTRVSYH